MMGAAYSVDLRRKVVQACERGTASQAEVARLFGVSRSFVEKLLRLRRRTGALEPNRKRAGRRCRTQLAPCESGRLICVDESGCNCAMTRRYGRARRGMRVHDSVPKSFGRNVTILGALSCTGLVAVMSVEGATDTAVFRAY